MKAQKGIVFPLYVPFIIAVGLICCVLALTSLSATVASAALPSPTPTPRLIFVASTPTPTPVAGKWILTEDESGVKTWVWQPEPVIVIPRSTSNTPTPIVIVIEASPTPTTLCRYDAAYVADVTIPDNTVLSPGERFDKTWRVRNTGDCVWELGSRLAFKSGTQMNVLDSQTVTLVAPGETIDITVTMYAPNMPGAYTGAWQMTDALGSPFGQALTVVIQIPSPNPPTPTPEPAPPLPQFSAELVKWWPNCGISLVKGKVVERDGSPVNGLRVRVWADGWDGSLSLVSGIGLSYGPGEWDVLLRQGQSGKFYASVWDWQTGPDAYTRVDSQVIELHFNYTQENCQPDGDGHQVAEVRFIRNY